MDKQWTTAAFLLLILFGVLGATPSTRVDPAKQILRVGDDLRIICYTGEKINYCHMKHQSLDRNQKPEAWNLKPNSTRGNIEYLGQGFEAGQCGILIRNVQESHNGNFRCTIGLDAHINEAVGEAEVIVARGLITASGHMKIIRPNSSEMILNASQQLYLICEGDSQIVWKYPQYKGSDKKKPLISQINMQSYLKRDAVDYRDVGNYSCHSERNPENFAVVYVFIRDLNHPISAAIQTYEIVAVAKGNVTIPCKPSYPGVTLKICTEENDDVQDMHNGLQYIGDKKGFLWSQLTLSDSQPYSCCYQSCHTCRFKELFFVKVYGRNSVIPEPRIKMSTDAYAGQNTTIECSVKVDYRAPDFKLNWNVPPHTEMKTDRKWANRSEIIPDTLILHIWNVSINDRGLYECKLQNFGEATTSIYQLKVMDDSTQKTMNLSFNGNFAVEQKDGETAVFVVTIKSFLEPEITWYAPDGNVIKDDVKYRMSLTRNQHYEAKLTVYNVSIRDQGIYQLKAKNKYTSSSINGSLTVPGGLPFLHVTDEVEFCKVHTKCELECAIWGGSVKWYFKPCSYFNSSSDSNYVPVKGEIINRIGKNNEDISVLLFPANQSGSVLCSGSNKNGQSNKTIQFVVTDIPQGKNFSIIYPNRKIYENDNITIECRASKYYFTDKISWFKDNTPIGSNVEENTVCDTIFSYCSQLRFINATTSMNGMYYCKAKRRDSQEEMSSTVYRLHVEEFSSAKIQPNTNLNMKEKNIVLGSDFQLMCSAVGKPPPNITWYKDKTEIVSGDNGFTLKNGRKELIITGFNKQHEGQYTCVAKNRDSEDKRTMYLRISDGGPNSGYIAAIIIVVILLIVLLIFIVIRIRKQKKLQKILCETGLAYFAKGMPESMDLERPIDEQAEFLPYDQMWEFPPDKLKLGRQLGSGAFGVVLKAEAFGIIEGQSSTIVAVKMVKPTADAIFIKALASELKIMVHLGKHLNVVNLLGACTNKIGKGELMVIVEYCKFGNLHNYLLRNRDGFIDQIDKETGSIDLQEKVEDNVAIESPKHEKRKYSHLISFSNSGGSKGEFQYQQSNQNYVSSSNSTVHGGVISMKQTGESSGLTSNSSNEQEWRSNYRADYKGKLRRIYTKDLIYWAYQVSRGMEYLCTRNVLHGDLAARNILLSENNIVKICDFGLAKSLYKSANYTKKSTGPLPFKWMAIESLRDGVFSTQSDVWAFGIVLWELFSLARSPYPGMHADENLYNKLMKGHRMEKPLYATDLIYDIMLDCWNANPMKRPSFTDLKEVLGTMLDEETLKVYANLDYPYTNMNNLLNKNKTVREDYLIMMTAPNYSNVAYPSQSENETMFMNRNTLTRSSNIDTSGYLTMSTTSIPRSSVFSPTPDTSEGKVFSFQVSSRKRMSQYPNSDGSFRNNENGAEEILNEESNKDKSSNISSEILNNSFSNPQYQARL